MEKQLTTGEVVAVAVLTGGLFVVMKAIWGVAKWIFAALGLFGATLFGVIASIVVPILLLYLFVKVFL